MTDPISNLASGFGQGVGEHLAKGVFDSFSAIRKRIGHKFLPAAAQRAEENVHAFSQILAAELLRLQARTGGDLDEALALFGQPDVGFVARTAVVAAAAPQARTATKFWLHYSANGSTPKRTLRKQSPQPRLSRWSRNWHVRPSITHGRLAYSL